MCVAKKYNLTEILGSGLPVDWGKVHGANVICKKVGGDIEIHVTPKMSDALSLKHANGDTYEESYLNPKAWFQHLEQGDILNDVVYNICLDAWEGREDWELLIEENIVRNFPATHLPLGQCFSGEYDGKESDRRGIVESVKHGIVVEYPDGERAVVDLTTNKTYPPERVKVTTIYGIGTFNVKPAHLTYRHI